jgi:SAM-dependent methyltransferase
MVCPSPGAHDKGPTGHRGASSADTMTRMSVTRRVFETLRSVVARIGADPPPPRLPMHVWHLDAPSVTQAPADPARFEASGWIAAKDPVESIGFDDPELAALLPVAVAERPDVVQTYGLPATGFAASCGYESVKHLDTITLRYVTREGSFPIVLPVYRPTLDIGELKRQKLARLRPRLQCPACGSAAFDDEPKALRCGGCSAEYPRSAERFDFLTPELRAAFNIVPTSNVSANGYDGEALNIIHRLNAGLILDCGAGLRDRYFPNVVNYEIVAYDSTDVLGVGEKLPFQDATFDAVFSFAVLEHVKDPFACSRELLRVLKPGGTLYCQVPLLQPVHGYPHHYYNMTLTGMLGLFGDAIRIERAGSFQFGQPVFALSWILNRYADGLPAEQRAAFRAMRVEDLMLPAARYLGSPFVTTLSDEARQELSCCNALIGTKVGP